MNKLTSRTLSITRSYHSFYHVNEPIVNLKTIENQILNKAYVDYVPKLGFTSSSVFKASKDIGLKENTPNALFKFTSTDSNDLSMQLVLFHLKKCRLELEKISKSDEFKNLDSEFNKLQFLINKRLEMNIPIIKDLPNLLGHLIIPSNLISSMNELHNLSDDISYYAGDRSIDFKWYSKRMSISGLFVQSELFMINDKSDGFSDTKEFVLKKLNEIENAGYVYNSIEEWSFFNAVSLVNLIKSKLSRG